MDTFSTALKEIPIAQVNPNKSVVIIEVTNSSSYGFRGYVYLKNDGSAIIFTSGSDVMFAAECKFSWQVIEFY